ncbi:sterol desaturase family protein [Tolypothrix campylonemoides VB511288_2]|uniref:Sterol desaturase n=3 Tax=Nostocales TaxID=1161 RepID=A0A0C1RNH8_9CYAN|nr:sterol desaturase family protein [Tolypothrix bouteillei]
MLILLSYVYASLTAVFVILFLLERIFPLRLQTHSLIKRLFINSCITALAFATNAAVVQPTAQFMLQWTQLQSFGLVHLVPLPTAIKSVMAFLLMDLTYYYWHRANHRFLFLWRFHNVHHIDPDLDISTGFRFHGVEILLSAGLRVFQIALTGISQGTYILYELVYQANTLFHHSNIRLPIWTERWLNTILVTPRMHGVHHSQVQDETNSNYSVIFPWWDKLHQTLRLNVPQSEIEIGIPAYSSPDDNTLQHLWLVPFQKQRDYWRKPDNKLVERSPSVLGEDLSRMVDFSTTSIAPNLSLRTE